MSLCLAVLNRADSLLFISLNEELQQEGSKRRREEVEMFLYCSCDIIGEKAKMTTGKTSQEPYLGSLLLNNAFRSYGYLTNTGVKFMLVVDAVGSLLKDQDLRALFKRLHTDYCKAISNPFYAPDSAIQSRFLDEAAKEILGRG